MKSAQEVLDNIRERYKNKQVLSSDEKLCIAMKEYAKEVVDHILTRDDLIRTDEGDAIYDYDEFERLKNELK